MKKIPWGILVVGGLVYWAGKELGFFSTPSGSLPAADRVIQEGASGSAPNFNDLQYQAFADTIHDALRDSWIADDKPTAKRVLLYMQNILDLAKLVKAYGDRTTYLFGIPDGPPKNLAQTIAGELSEEDLEAINNIYRLRGIQYSF